MTPKQQSGQHWDPGPYWNWQHYMELLGAQDSGVPGIVSADPNGQIVIISPDFATNQPNVTYCYSAGDCRPVAPQPSNFVYLRTAPSQDAPLLGDPALRESLRPRGLERARQFRWETTARRTLDILRRVAESAPA